VIEKRPRLILTKTKCTQPATVVYTEEVIPLAERACRTVLCPCTHHLATIQEQPPPAIWRGVQENTEDTRAVSGIAFTTVHLKVGIDGKGVRPTQPSTIIREGECFTSVRSRTKQRAHRTCFSNEIGIEHHLDLLTILRL